MHGETIKGQRVICSLKRSYRL